MFDFSLLNSGLSRLNNSTFSGVAWEASENSLIQHCALGQISDQSEYMHSRIISNKNDTTLNNNGSLDVNTWGGSDRTANGRDGENISAALFNQSHFEHTLGWDFDTVWEWDSNRNQPTLRKPTATSSAARSGTLIDTSQLEANQSTLLHEQLKANIWL